MRNVNFTKRLQLTANEVEVRRVPAVDGQLAFELKVDFSRLNRHHGAGIVDAAMLAAEVYIGSRSERFDCGISSKPRLVGHISKQFRDDDRVLFRFKVIDTVTDPGRLLGLRSMMRTGQDDNPHGSLLGFDVQPLDGVPFKIDYASQSEPPVLVLNQDIHQADVARIKLFAKTNGTFLSIVLPAAAREILTRYLLIDEFPPTDLDSPPQPFDLWYRFAEQYSSQALSAILCAELSEKIEWIDDAVRGMAKDWKAIQRLREAILEER